MTSSEDIVKRLGGVIQKLRDENTPAKQIVAQIKAAPKVVRDELLKIDWEGMEIHANMETAQLLMDIMGPEKAEKLCDMFESPEMTEMFELSPILSQKHVKTFKTSIEKALDGLRPGFKDLLKFMQKDD